MGDKNINFQQFLKGYYRTLPYVGEARAANWMNDPALSGILEKADTIMGPTGTAAWYDPVYSADLTLEALTRSDTLLSLIPKTTFQQKGDSFKYIAADSATGFKAAIGENGVIVNGTSSVPTPTDVDNIFPAVVECDWLDSEVGRALSAIQNEPINDPAYIRKYMSDYFVNQINMALAGVAISATVHGVDTPAVSGSKAAVECLDRMVTTKAEAGGTSHVSTATDGDIFWNEAGSGSARIVRAASAAWDAQVKLPTTPGTEEAYDILSELDDLMAVAKKYRNGTGAPNYIGVCSDKAINKIQNELDPKATYLEGQMYVTQNLNGVSTRTGVEGGKIPVAGLSISGVKVPFFPVSYLDGTVTSTWLWKNSVYTSGGVGNIYLLNMDALEFRTLIPITYKSMPNTTNNSAPGLGNINVLYMAGQLIARQWASHAALKYIKA